MRAASAAIGFCFGGTMALELARSGADIKAVVGFHSGLATAAPTTDAEAIKGQSWSASAPTTRSSRPSSGPTFEAEMRAAGADWQMHLYGGTVHSFTNPEAARRNMPDKIRYSPEAVCAAPVVHAASVFAETLGM